MIAAEIFIITRSSDDSGFFATMRALKNEEFFGKTCAFRRT